MIILLIHSKEFSFETREPAIKSPEEPKLSSFKGENVLVVFTSVEAGDDEKVLERAVKEVNDVKEKVKAESVVIYPYAHLSDNLAKPSDAVRILDQFTQRLSDLGIEVVRAPFGWYKSFTISCYGHPLSELSRRIRNEKEYEKSDELKVCEKFGFPDSVFAVVMRRSALDWLKRLIPHKVELEGEGEVKDGVIRIIYSQPKGRRLPCINEDPMITVRTKSLPDGLPREVKDSKNTIEIIEKKGDAYDVHINPLIYYYLLEASKSSPPTLPLWLSPVQVRLIPVKEESVQMAIEIAELLRSKGYRADVDDLGEGLGKKIARAGMEWVPFVIIIGEREFRTGVLTIKIREKNEQRQVTLNELLEVLKGSESSTSTLLPLRVSERLNQ